MPPVFVSTLLRWLLSAHQRRLHVRASLWAAAVTTLVLLGGAWLVVRAEASAPHATITSFPLGVWWSIETATTVGYGDMYPVTAWGRVIACVVMLVGIALFGIVTAALATWFVGGAARGLRELGGTLKRAEHVGREDASEEVRSLHERFDRLERLLREGGGPPAPR
ncbi:potassium channel family protein [Streptomyces sp. NBC_01089]|uniref:potassium channel family protein n=1 Tax=Streptomyces sp. NBC_01089 TaxID=2903747 RepID=UPI00386F57C9|nr:potassium channel family protein [Streptomyces sp. NBC_01089]